MNIRHEDPCGGAVFVGDSATKRPVQVLIVDDAEDIRDYLGVVLRSNGYRVLEAADGLVARSILKLEHPALVISDLEMPVSDGWEVLTFCHDHCPETPVMIVSGAALGRQPEIERWAASFVPKPFSIARFRAEVERLISRAA